MKKTIFLLACCFYLSNTSCQTLLSKDIEEQIKLVENSLAGRIKFEGMVGDNILERMAFHKVKGLSIAVIKDHKIIWAKGYGWADESEKRPVTEKTMFQAASISKSINSMGVMKLVQDKKLDLNKDINDYLVSWKFPYDEVSKGQKITTLNLLTHTGGLSNSAPMYHVTDTIPTNIQTLNGARPSKLMYGENPGVHSIMAPNVKFEYSNPGVAITQVIVTDIAKKPYQQYMYETVFKPLGMTNSFYTEDSAKVRKAYIATGHNNGYELPGKHVIVPMLSAGGLWTTPTDLAKFIIEMQLSHKGKSNKVLSKETVDLMLKPYMEAAPGIMIKQTRSGEKYFSHSGSVQGFKCEYFGSVEGGDGVVVMINSAGNAGNIIPEVVNSVATVYQWKDFYDPILKPKPIAAPDKMLAKCEGVYVFHDNNQFKHIVITKKADGGHYWTDGQEWKMHFTGEKEFFNVESLSNKEIITDASGNVTAIKRFVDGKEIGIAVKVKNADTLHNPFQLGNTAWYLLTNKKFADAISFFKRRIELEPKEMMARCNLAHCYLFSKEYDKAIQLYKENIDKGIDANYTFKSAMLEDFVFFKKNGFDTALMDKALADLKLEKPVGY